MLDAEAALAGAEAKVGLVPEAAAEEIVFCCAADRFDRVAISTEARATGNPAEPLARALRRAVPPDAARYVHFGATSQDILDTASMLIARRVLSLIEPELDGLAAALADLAETHRDTLMVGRTLLQHALPITFGLKAAQWLAGITRAHEGLRRLHGWCLAVELGGAAGTLASLGGSGIAVLHEFARLLDLAEPDLPWHAERSRPAEIGAALSITAGVIEKIALDITLLAQTEVAEVAEGDEPGRGASSTLPQKRNPAGSVLARACAREAQAAGEFLVRGMAHEHERAAGVWQPEWQALSDALAFTGSAVTWLDEVVAGLEVDTERMRANLESSGGVVMAERVTLLLGERTGRERAHHLMRTVSRRVKDENGTLGAALLADSEVRRYLSVEEIEAAMDPATYLGATHAFIDRVLARHRSEQEEQQ